MVMSTLPPLPLPEEMRQWDEASFALGLPEVMLMENASRAALRALEICGVPPAGRRIWLFMGGGNNGGDAAALARHLLDAGGLPTVWHTRPLGQYRGACGQHVRMARRCGVPFLPVGRCLAGEARKGPELPHIVVDGLLGTGFHGELRPDMLALVRHINALRREAFVLALDVPSGLDAASGRPQPEAVRAHATVTFEAAKYGLVLPESAPFTGRLLTLPIGIPLAVRRTAPCSARLLSADVLGHLPPFRPQLARILIPQPPQKRGQPPSPLKPLPPSKRALRLAPPLPLVVPISLLPPLRPLLAPPKLLSTISF